MVGETTLPDDPVDLAIDVADETYQLAAGSADGTLEQLGAGDARYLSTEVATGFTGVYLGPYATGNGAESDERARFLDFEYAPTAEELLPVDTSCVSENSARDQTTQTSFSSVPMASTSMLTESSAWSVKESPGTMAVPVNRTASSGIELCFV